MIDLALDAVLQVKGMFSSPKQVIPVVNFSGPVQRLLTVLFLPTAEFCVVIIDSLG